jgi:hypothetical protein
LECNRTRQKFAKIVGGLPTTLASTVAVSSASTVAMPVAAESSPMAWPFPLALQGSVPSVKPSLVTHDTVNLVNNNEVTGPKGTLNDDSGFKRPQNWQKLKTDSDKVKRTTSSGNRSSSRSLMIVGKSISVGLIYIKGADLTVNRHIGCIDNSVELETLCQYVSTKDVTVVELEQLDTKHSRFKSFRLRVKKLEIRKVDDPEFWEEKIIIRPFYKPRSPRINSDGINTTSNSTS